MELIIRNHLEIDLYCFLYYYFPSFSRRETVMKEPTLPEQVLILIIVLIVIVIRDMAVAP